MLMYGRNRASLVVQMVENPPTMQETPVPWVREIPLEDGILAWRIPQSEEPGGLQSMGLQRVGHD